MQMMQKSVLRKCQKLSAFDQVEREFLMQERHDRDLKESVMLGLPFQTSWVMENLHHLPGGNINSGALTKRGGTQRGELPRCRYRPKQDPYRRSAHTVQKIR